MSQWLTGTVHFFKDKLKHMILSNDDNVGLSVSYITVY